MPNMKLFIRVLLYTIASYVNPQVNKIIESNNLA